MKMKKLLQWTLLFALSLLIVLPRNTLTTHAADSTYNSYTYTVSNNEATITGYTGSDSTLTIPATVNGYIVTTIADGAFQNNTRITNVKIPSSVTAIGGTNLYSNSGAFAGCSSLKTVTINTGIEPAYIGVKSFYECKSLQSITIPGNYTTLYANAFDSCSSLSSVTYQVNTTSTKQSIHDSAFANCSKLTTLSLPTTLNSIGYSAFINANIHTLIIPEGVTQIADSAFRNNRMLSSVSLPSTLTLLGSTSFYNGQGVFADCAGLKTVTIKPGTSTSYIGVKTFAGCKSLSQVSIPGNYVKIYRQAFYSCSSLTSLTYQKNTSNTGIQEIEEEAFRYCTSLSIVALPTTLVKIGTSAFANDNIKTLRVPEGVTTIAESAFAENKGLTSVTLPSTLVSLGGTSYYNSEGAFANCSNLTTVSFTKGTENAYVGVRSFENCTKLNSVTIPGNYERIYKSAFQSCTSLTSFTFQKGQYGYANQEIHDYAFYNCTNLSVVSLPTTLNQISTFAFSNCFLQSLVIPEGVTTLGESAFSNNTSLRKVSLPSTITSLGGQSYLYSKGVFQDCKNLTTVTLKAGQLDAYIGTRTFSGCTNLRGIVVPKNYQKIYAYAFNDCSSLGYFINSRNL